MKLEDLEIFHLSMRIGEMVWGQVKKWQFFEKDTVGKQFVRAIDSVAANISEGFGRYHYKDKLNFYYCARGSIYETKTFLSKSLNRGLVEAKVYQEIIDSLDLLGVKLNNYINITRKTITNDFKAV